jgi:hypothetical protein
MEILVISLFSLKTAIILPPFQNADFKDIENNYSDSCFVRVWNIVSCSEGKINISNVLKQTALTTIAPKKN